MFSLRPSSHSSPGKVAPPPLPGTSSSCRHLKFREMRHSRFGSLVIVVAVVVVVVAAVAFAAVSVGEGGGVVASSSCYMSSVTVLVTFVASW